MAVGLLLVLLLLVGAVVVVAVAGVVVTYLVKLKTRGVEQARAAHQLVPGQDGVAPTAWAGSHDPEALLHRRLVQALAAVRQAEGAGGFGVTDLRIQLELQAEQLDRRLVALSAATGVPRVQGMEAVTADVLELENVAGQTVAVAGGSEPDPAALEGLSRRLREIGPGAG